MVRSLRSRSTQKGLTVSQIHDSGNKKSKIEVSKENNASSKLVATKSEEKYRCGLCCKSFQTMILLSCHMSKHNLPDLFQCSLCDSVFPTPDSLLSHFEEHSDIPKPFKCGICNAAFIRNEELLGHLDSEHKELPSYYKCRVCSISFKDILQLVAHLGERHSKEKFKCHSCGREFGQGNNVLGQGRLHSQGSSKDIMCAICLSKVSVSTKSTDMFADEKEKDRNQTKSISARIHNRSKRKKRIGEPNKEVLKGIQKMNEKISVKQRKEQDAKDSDFDHTDAGSFESDLKSPENDIRIKQSRKKEVIESMKCVPHKGKPNPVIRDTETFISVNMKGNFQNGKNVYDCDVCGMRVNDRDAFIQHRDDHFSDGKFCINCQHCSQSFDSFEDLDDHIGPSKCTGYKCKICGKSFSLEPILLTHRIKEHSSLKKQDGILTCGVCGKIFENKTAFIRHASSHSEDKCIQCKLCKHAFTTQETLLGHLRTTHSVIPLTRKHYKFNCSFCGANFIKDEALSTHQAYVHAVEKSSNDVIKESKKEKLYESKSKNTISKIVTVKRTGHWRSAEDDKKRRTCPICNRVFERFKDVRRHIGTHTKPYLCSHCGKSFPYRYSLDAHTKAYHSSENPHRCEICNKLFSCERSLLIHCRIHTGEKPHQCHICHKSFRQVANLSIHVKLHSSEKPIKCKLCDYRCSHRGYLKRHMSTHSKDKPHICPICNKGFTEKPNLNHHLKRHSKVKAHICSVCGHRFAERYYLNSHMRIHTKEKPYICPECKRAFTMRPNMVAHIKKTHPSYNYQPIRTSHSYKQVSDSELKIATAATTITTSNEVEANNTGIFESGDQYVYETPSNIVDSTAVSNRIVTDIDNKFNPEPSAMALATNPQALLTPLQPLSSSQLPELSLDLEKPMYSDSISVGTSDFLIPRKLTQEKLGDLSLPQSRDILDSFPGQRKQALQQPSQQQPVQNFIQGNYTIPRNFKDGFMEQTTCEQQNEIQDQFNKKGKISDSRISSHLDDTSRTVSFTSSTPFFQNFPSASIVSQDYLHNNNYSMVLPSYDNVIPVSVPSVFVQHSSSQLTDHPNA